MIKNLTKKERLKRNLLKVGEVAKMVGVLRSTIFFYANEGLLKPVDYNQGKYRLFKKLWLEVMTINESKDSAEI